VTITAAVGFLAVSGTVEAAGWQYLDVNGNGYYDTAYYDGNNDGRWEYVYADVDENRQWDVFMQATGDWQQFKLLQTGAVMWTLSGTDANWIYVDGDGNGRYEVLAYDGNRDGNAEYKRVDTNGDGVYDSSWVSLASPAPQWTAYGAGVKTALDMWLWNANNRLVDIWL